MEFLGYSEANVESTVDVLMARQVDQFVFSKATIPSHQMSKLGMGIPVWMFYLIIMHCQSI